jgi:thioredoxin 1
MATKTPDDPKIFFDLLRQNSRPVVVDIWAGWCMPCRTIAATIVKLKQDYDGRVDVWQVNADDSPRILQALRVRGIPTLIAFNQGYEISRLIGVRPDPVLESIFQAALDGVARIPSLSLTERIFRTFSGAILMLIAEQQQFEGLMMLVALIGLIVFFAGIYDQFQIFRSLKSRIDRWFNKKPEK